MRFELLVEQLKLPVEQLVLFSDLFEFMFVLHVEYELGMELVLCDAQLLHLLLDQSLHLPTGLGHFLVRKALVSLGESCLFTLLDQLRF